MKKIVQKYLLIVLGWFFVILGAVGVVLPILPTTPFLILALACFAKSSLSFHRILINNRWFGASLKQWEEKKSVSRQTKWNAFVLVLVSFSLSIAILSDRLELQVFLIGMATVLLFFIWRLKET